ncbi:helix-turn-helix domain-containing protein [Paenibacillus chondroitinus]|uniref:Helix-turn-helix domain-containing protein n=1 Tax=Paenibacillus chondroitinus TaxID=59842 RepID=A0ABU6DFM0_9BACL|nr:MULTISPECIES: helix-turn-helix domain-containing protein [Paenibacillus]MCY9659201.1 helix-turn-helix domain-containing protein [Paenibacillus anseongense]MEB4796464.1 helix-turn-helix domain-containing protein [Paenibacillus chondroitinus]
MKFNRIRFNKRSVIVTWLTSYISVLLVPIIISGILYAASWHVVESEVNRANNNALKQMELAIDNSLGGIERLSLEISLNKQVNAFINTSQPLTDNDYYDLVTISNDLRVYQTANEFIEQIYLYYKNSDTVISTRNRTDSRQLFQMLDGQTLKGYEAWKTYLDKRYIQEYTPVTITEDDNAYKAVLFAKSVTLANRDQPGAVLLFVMKDSKLLANIPPSEATSVAVLDKENRLVASSGLQQSPDFLTYDKFTGENGLFYGDVAAKQVAVSYTTSARTGWKYMSMIPAERFDDKMKYMKSLVYASIILSLLLGGLVTFLFLRKNYNPIHHLIRSFSMKAGISFAEGTNEYGFLQDALNNTFAEKEQVDRRLHQHRDAIRSHFLQGLLKGNLEQDIPVHESLSAHDIRLDSPHFAVILFHIDHFGKFQDDVAIDPQKVKLMQFILMNVVEEVIGLQNQGFTTEIEDMQACIFNFGSEEPDTDELNRVAESVKLFLLDHFHVHLTVSISSVHEDLFGIAEAYQEALSAMAYRLVKGSGAIIRYDELPSTEAVRQAGTYYYPLHVEQQLINFIKTGDYEKSSTIIEQIIETNVSNSVLSVPLGKCLMFDLASTMLKTMNEIGSQGNKKSFMEQFNPVERLSECETIKEMKREILSILEQVCESIQADRKQEYSPLGDLVSAYVKANYAEENLNISMIGEKFGITPSYLSKQFKAQTGDALLDFISRTRLEEAKKLLTEQPLSIVEIARKVGYNDINTFNRTFKKFEGITPGKYKELKPL